MGALGQEQIAGAALDVLGAEPMTADNPLRNFDNVWITSHLAGQTVEARERAVLAAAQAVIDVLEGRNPSDLSSETVSRSIRRNRPDSTIHSIPTGSGVPLTYGASADVR